MNPNQCGTPARVPARRPFDRQRPCRRAKGRHRRMRAHVDARFSRPRERMPCSRGTSGKHHLTPDRQLASELRRLNRVPVDVTIHERCDVRGRVPSAAKRASLSLVGDHFALRFGPMSLSLHRSLLGIPVTSDSASLLLWSREASSSTNRSATRRSLAGRWSELLDGPPRPSQTGTLDRLGRRDDWDALINVRASADVGLRKPRDRPSRQRRRDRR